MTPDIRKRFHLPEEGVYFLNHSVGCLPVSAEEQFRHHFLEPWKTKGSHAWEDWLDNLMQFNAALAGLLNSKTEQFCPQVNLSSALTKILSSLPLSSGRHQIVLSENDFPSMGFVIQQFCQHRGFEACFFTPNG